LDVLDPWRLPARQTEDIHLPFTRPDIPLWTSPQGILTEDDSYFLVTENFSQTQPASEPGNPNYVAPLTGWFSP
jgi:hypothetical protein